MALAGLAHYSIRTTDTERSCAFYERVLGFRRGFRPAFDFPGARLYRATTKRLRHRAHHRCRSGQSAGLSAYPGDRTLPASGTGTLDHIAFLATGVRQMWDTLRAAGIPWRDRTVPGTGLHRSSSRIRPASRSNSTTPRRKSPASTSPALRSPTAPMP